MNGFPIVDLFSRRREPRAHRRAHRRCSSACRVGEGIPVADFQTRSIDGRQLSVQATAVRVDTATGPATLSIFFDVTARQRVEAALRRSEAMLSQLFATSPDCIALTELASGRHALVNAGLHAADRLRSAEVVGRTSAELGIWHDLKDRDRLRRGDRPARHASPTCRWRSAPRPARWSRCACRPRASRWTGATTWSSTRRDVTESERTRLEHEAILERASIGIAFTRDRRFVQANPRFERDVRLGQGALAGKPGARRLAQRRRLRRGRPHRRRRCSRAGQQFELERQMRRARRQPVLVPPARAGGRPHAPGHGGTIWIAEDVTERRRLDQALAAARDAAEAASRAKSAFLANTSHEIRTPLNGLLGLARLALQPRRRRRRGASSTCAQILDSAQSLPAIISDILDLSKIEAGKIDARSRCRSTCASRSPRVQHAYRTLAEAQGPASSHARRSPTTCRATVLGDPVRVRQILTNFVTNAIKFTERGSVRIEARPTARRRAAPRGHRHRPRRRRSDAASGSSSRSRRATARRRGATAAPASACRSAASWRSLMGGEVGVDSRPGTAARSGPSCRCRPRDAGDAAPQHRGADLARLRGARVLMVEDNPVNMMIAVAHARAVGRARRAGRATAAWRSRRSRAAPPTAAASTRC